MAGDLRWQRVNETAAILWEHPGHPFKDRVLAFVSVVHPQMLSASMTALERAAAYRPRPEAQKERVTKERACRDCGSLIEHEDERGEWCIECYAYVHTKPWTARSAAKSREERGDG